MAPLTKWAGAAAVAGQSHVAFSQGMARSETNKLFHFSRRGCKNEVNAGLEKFGCDLLLGYFSTCLKRS